MRWVCPFSVLRVEPLKTIQIRLRSGCCGGQWYDAYIGTRIKYIRRVSTKCVYVMSF